MRFSLASAVGVSLVLGALPVFAQSRGPAADTTPPPAESAPAQPATNDAARATSTGNAGGYSYSDKAPKSTRAAAPARFVKKHVGPVVHLPGFEQTADGGSRLFVALSSTVPVEERKAQGSITYVLKNAGARVRNNTNALVTVHFNTPVSRAKLVPHGNDVLFVVEMRAAATPTWKMTESEDKSALLMIDFPKGDYTNAPEAPVAAGETAAKKAPAKAGPHGAAAAARKPAPTPKPAPAGPTP